MDWGSDTFGRPTTAGDGLGAGLATLLLGAALGAAAALLISPRTGQDLRARVAGVAGSWKEHAAEALAQSRESVVSAVEQAQGEPLPTDTVLGKGAVKPV